MLTGTPHFRSVRFGVLVVVAAMLTACGGGSKGSGGATSASTASSSAEATSTAATSTAATSTAATSTAATSTAAQTSTSAAGSSCTPSPAVLAAAKPFSEISKVSLIGGCGQVAVATTLAPGALGSPSASRAIAMCTAISKVAYVGPIFGVEVDGKDGHELAASTKGEQCI